MLKKTAVIALSVVIIACLFGCKKVESTKISVDKVDTENLTTSSMTSQLDTNSSAKTSEQTLPAKPQKPPKITINPVDVTAGADDLKKSMEELADAEIRRQAGDTADEIRLTLTNEITTQNDRFLSTVYQGDSEIDAMTNPKLVLFTQNIDLLTGKKLTLCDIAEVNEEFAKLAMDNAKSILDEVYVDFIGEMTEEDWLTRLNLVDTADSFDYSSYMNGTLTIFFEMPPVAGDFLPVTNIPWKDWESFAKDKSLVQPISEIEVTTNE